MPQKRILYVGNRLSVHGKSPTSADIIPRLLSAEGFDVEVVSSKLNKAARLYHMVWTVHRLRNQIDFVLIDTYSTASFYYAVLVAGLCRRYQLKYIPVLHGGNLPERLKKSPRRSQKLFGKAFMNVAPSGFIFNAFKENGFQNVELIPNFIPMENYPFKERNDFSYKLLWVRSFSSEYHPELALEIVEDLMKQGKPVSLTMVGPEKDGTLEKCKKIALEKNLPVTFTGVLPKEDWISLSRDFDFFINTTRKDNMPVSVIEAMALGLPVISTDVGGLPFLIETGKTGMLVPEGNASAFVNEISRLVENREEAMSIANHARKKVEAFDWQKVKDLWHALLQ